VNLTIDNAKVSAWKNLRAQYIAAACGLTLAVGALTGVAGWSGSGTIAPSTPARSSISISRAGERPERHVYFIAGSQQQATDHAASVTQGLNPAWLAAQSYFVVTNAEEEAQARYGIAQAMSEEGGVPIDVVDLRLRPGAGPEPQFAAAWDAEYAAQTVR
jgi:hypothetical protein